MNSCYSACSAPTSTNNSSCLPRAFRSNRGTMYPQRSSSAPNHIARPQIHRSAELTQPPSSPQQHSRKPLRRPAFTPTAPTAIREKESVQLGRYSVLPPLGQSWRMGERHPVLVTPEKTVQAQDNQRRRVEHTPANLERLSFANYPPRKYQSHRPARRRSIHPLHNIPLQLQAHGTNPMQVFMPSFSPIPPLTMMYPPMPLLHPYIACGMHPSQLQYIPYPYLHMYHTQQPEPEITELSPLH